MARNADILCQRNEIHVTSRMQDMDFDNEKLFVENGQEELPRPETVTVGIIQDEFVEDCDADSLCAQVSDPLDVDPLYVEEKPELVEQKQPTLAIVKNEPEDEDDFQEVLEDKKDFFKAESSNSQCKSFLSGEKTVDQCGSASRILWADIDLTESSSLKDLDTVTVTDEEQDAEIVTVTDEKQDAEIVTITDEHNNSVQTVDKTCNALQLPGSDNASKESTEVQACTTTIDVQKGKVSQNAKSESLVVNKVQYKASMPKVNAEGKLVVLLTRCKVAERLLCEPDASFHSVKRETVDIHNEIDDQTSANEEEITNENSMLSVSREQYGRTAEEIVTNENELDRTPAENLEKPVSPGLRVENPCTIAEIAEFEAGEAVVDSSVEKAVLDSSVEKAVLDSSVEKAVLRCIDCFKVFELQSSLIGHRPRCRERKKNACHERKNDCLLKSGSKCSLCGKIFNRRSSLLDHMNTHSSQENLPFKCRICKQCFSSPVDLDTHSRVHLTLKQFECEECPRRFLSMKALRLHLTKTHNQRRSSVSKIADNVERKSYEHVPSTGIHPSLPSSLGPEILECVVPNSVPNKNMETESVFHCHICNEVFNTYQSLNDHGIIHARELLQPYLDGTAKFCREGKLWCCPVCAKTRSSKFGLKQHMRLHLNIKPFKCHVCRASFIYKYLLKKHVEKVHSGEKTHPCNICGVVYNNPNTLRLHKRRHKQIQRFPCSYCGMFFSSGHHLYAHKCSGMKQKLVHSSANKMIHTTKPNWKAHLTNSKDYAHGVDTGPKYTSKTNFTCSICGKILTSRTSLKMHMYVHTGKPYKCDLCNKRFSRLFWLDNHIRTRHKGEKPYNCGLCDRSYCRPDSLSLHKRLVHMQKPAKEGKVPGPELPPGKQKPKCYECNSLFSTTSYLKRHNNRYHPLKKTDPDNLTGGERFPCNICGIIYSSSNSLRVHCRRMHSGNNESEREDISNVLGIQTHSSKKTYECDICDATFTTSRNLQIHYHDIHKVKYKVMSPYRSQNSCKRYKCDHCNITCSSASNLLAHSNRFHKDKENETEISGIQSETNDGRYKCKHCNIICSSLNNLLMHNCIHKEEDKKSEKEYKCDSCNITYHKFASFQSHCWRKHKTKINFQVSKKTVFRSSKFHSIEKRFKCHPCNTTFINRSYLQSHINVVHGRKKDKIFAVRSNSSGKTYGCDHCDFICPSRSSLINHVCLPRENPTEAEGALRHSFTSNSVKELGRCDKCKKTFYDLNHLIRHICSVPNQKSKEKDDVIQSCNETFKCEVCSAVFLQKYKLLEHNCNLNVKKKSSNEFLSKTKLSNPYKQDCRKLCLVCGESFTLLNDLKDHMLIHTSQEPSFDCNICSKTFLTAQKLAVHSRIHYGFKRKLITSSSFVSSLNTKKATENHQKNKCKLCGKVLSNSASLKRHVMIHTGERPYSCEICGQGYREHNKLVLHLGTHDSSDYLRTPFKCVVCDKTFLKKGNLIRHQSVCN